MSLTSPQPLTTGEGHAVPAVEPALSDRALTFSRPARLEFGPGAVRRLQPWAAGRGIGRILVVADAYNGRRADVLALEGEVAVFADVVPEPDLPNLAALLAVAAEAKPDLIVGFGGGSAMDLAKLSAVLIGGGAGIRDIVGVDKAAPRRVLLAQVSTTAGTGSEVGMRALVTDPQSRGKLAVESVHMLADFAAVDPELMLSLPPHVTAATGVDALAHCVEAFTSKRAHPLIDLYAREGIALVGRFLRRAVENGADLEARSGLALASLYGGYCLGPVNTTAGHAISYPLGTRHKIAHGLANAVIFPHALAINAEARPLKTRLIADLLGLDKDDLFGSAYRFCAGLGLEMRLSALGVPEDDLASMAREAHAIRRLLDFNPRDISADEILAIYRAAY